MSTEVKTINLGSVNCYLVRCGDGFVLIDTAYSGKRKELVAELDAAGCKPGNLRLVLLTHGDVDHSGNAAFLQREYKAKVAMHADDAGMVEQGNIDWNRKRKSDEKSMKMRVILLFIKLILKRGSFEKFKPDLLVDEQSDLSVYGFDGRIVHIPGHSKGSIGIILGKGDLYCGDFLYNTRGLTFIDDAREHDASAKRLQSLTIRRIFPGHGKSFSEEQVPALLRRTYSRATASR